MRAHRTFSPALLAALTLLAAIIAPPPAAAVEPARAGRHEDLVSLFIAWRAFQRPNVVKGVPDYTSPAMAAQQRDLASWQRKLVAVDPNGWPIAQQVDWRIVRAEMNGLEFDQRVLRPWANNPAFYVTVFTEESDQPAREGPLAHGAVELWNCTFPLTPDAAEQIGAGFRAIPPLLDQARGNLVGDGKDLWTYGVGAIEQQGKDLAAFVARLETAPGGPGGGLRADALRAREATDSFAAWLRLKLPSKTGPSGIGVDNYDWYLANVQLVPGTWRDEVTIMERELARASALLALEEVRHAGLPDLVPIASAEEHALRLDAGVTDYMKFLEEHRILTVTPDMGPALRAHAGAFKPGPREFFTEVDYRDLEVMRTHGYHWFDKARLKANPPESPIRRTPLLYNIFNTRTEGHATGWEEMMLQAGMFDDRPRSRELVYILLAERAARALGDLRMQSREWSLEEAATFASRNTPRGWLRLDMPLVRAEQHLYLQQPGYGISYIAGKIEIEKLLAERRRQLGESFSMQRFMDEFNAAGLVPASLLRWELTGEKP